MSTTLGKRKREVVVATRKSRRGTEDEQPTSTPSGAEHDIFRKYFESAFEPLPETTVQTPALSEEEEEEEEEEEGLAGDISEDDDSAWDGLSDAEQEHTTVEIVEHRTLTDTIEEPELRRKHYKTFMTPRPPKDIEQMPQRKPDKQADEEDFSEELNLKHDLDLQRLLKESHLLEEAKTASTPGKHRHKAVDMRLQSLGSKGSIFHQEKMPLTHRRGIIAKAVTREAVRRKEARENGIILEKPTEKTNPSRPRRERGVDVPAVGRFRGGTLKLSKRDIVDIQGPSHAGGRGRGRGKGGRR